MTLLEWLNSRETQLLQAALRNRKMETLRLFLAGQPVDPVMQGRAAALHDIEQLLGLPADEVKKILEEASKEHNWYEHRRPPI